MLLLVYCEKPNQLIDKLTEQVKRLTKLERIDTTF
jgi:hypothetical protein